MNTSETHIETTESNAATELNLATEGADSPNEARPEQLFDAPPTPTVTTVKPATYSLDHTYTSPQSKIRPPKTLVSILRAAADWVTLGGFAARNSRSQIVSQEISNSEGWDSSSDSKYLNTDMNEFFSPDYNKSYEENVATPTCETDHPVENVEIVIEDCRKKLQNLNVSINQLSGTAADLASNSTLSKAIHEDLAVILDRISGFSHTPLKDRFVKQKNPFCELARIHDAELINTLRIEIEALKKVNSHLLTEFGKARISNELNFKAACDMSALVDTVSGKRGPQYLELMSMSLQSLIEKGYGKVKLSRSEANALKKIASAGCHTIDQLSKTADTELLNIKGLGEISLEHVKSVLSRLDVVSVHNNAAQKFAHSLMSKNCFSPDHPGCWPIHKSAQFSTVTRKYESLEIDLVKENGALEYFDLKNVVHHGQGEYHRDFINHFRIRSSYR